MPDLSNAQFACLRQLGTVASADFYTLTEAGAAGPTMDAIERMGLIRLVLKVKRKHGEITHAGRAVLAAAFAE